VLCPVKKDNSPALEDSSGRSQSHRCDILSNAHFDFGERDGQLAEVLQQLLGHSLLQAARAFVLFTPVRMQRPCNANVEAVMRW